MRPRFLSTGRLFPALNYTPSLLPPFHSRLLPRCMRFPGSCLRSEHARAIPRDAAVSRVRRRNAWHPPLPFFPLPTLVTLLRQVRAFLLPCLSPRLPALLPCLKAAVPLFLFSALTLLQARARSSLSLPTHPLFFFQPPQCYPPQSRRQSPRFPFHER